MTVLVLNCGSSSVKFQLIDPGDPEPLGKGLVERVGTRDAILTYQSLGKDQSEIDAVGHRVVHGGEKFKESVLIDDRVTDGVRACIRFAPLHNPHNLKGITVAVELLPGVPQVAVFDTAFHQTMPPEAYTYALPLALCQRLGIRRYGFHGTSHKYVAAVAAEELGRPIEELRIITCHLGNGASIAAVKHGVSVETSMGFTPLEGLVMGTRCGDIDPAIVLHLMEREGLDVRQMNDVLNKRSGLLGLSNVSNDMRAVLERADEGDRHASLAVEVFCHRGKKYVGSYAAVMGGLDALVFTGGIGENSPPVRAGMCEGLEFLGIDVSQELNEKDAPNIGVGATPVLVIHTNEELAIARDTERVLRGQEPA
jgi:acetate kinase